MRKPIIVSCLLALSPLAAQSSRPGPQFDGSDVRDVRVEARSGRKPSIGFGARMAVVVGVNRYAHLSPLSYAEKDAKDVAKVLTELGFTVTLMTLDSREAPYHAEAILSAITRVCRDADSQDTLLVALSGHGFSQQGSKDGWFCAHYTDPTKLEVTGLSLEEVRRRLVASKATQRMLLVDACRNRPGQKAGGDRLEISPEFRATGLGVLFSTSPGTVSREPRPGSGIEDRFGRTIENGIFTHFVLGGIAGDADANGDGWVTFREVAYYAWREVKAATSLQQKPYLDWVGEAGGDFLIRQLPTREGARPEAASRQPVATTSTPQTSEVGSWGETVRMAPDPAIVTDVDARRRVTALGLPWRVRHRKTGAILLLVPPGEFLMGASDGEDEAVYGRRHRRQIRHAFYMGETEVSQSQWSAVMQNLPKVTFKGPDRPVDVGSRDQGEFLRRAGVSLPSEAQWEYACRAGTYTKWNSGAEMVPGVENLGSAATTDVGSLRRNDWGFFDMHGNVLEECLANYRFGSEAMDDQGEVAPPGYRRVFRGGSWRMPRGGSSARHRGVSYEDGVGLRIVVNLPATLPLEKRAEGVAEWGEILYFAPDPRVVLDPEVREAIRATGLPWRVRDRKAGITMLLVPAGTFEMGSPPSEAGRADTERRHRRVIEKPFYMGATEVTQAEWTRAMGSNSSLFRGERRPIEQVGFKEIGVFLRKIGMVLPTEVQWEYVCRAGGSAPFSTGSELVVHQACFMVDGADVPESTAVVASYRANGFGFHDMHGNVWEVCMNTDRKPATSMAGESARVGEGFPVLRGGAWKSTASQCRSACRCIWVDNNGVRRPANTIGLRVARFP